MTRDRALGRVGVHGTLAGGVAGLAMATYAMAASVWMGQGLFTPLYGIASPLIGPREMEASMMQGVYLNAGPALLGLVIHLAWSALYGALFGLIWRRIAVAGLTAPLVGVLYGLLVMVFMMFVVLPLVGAGEMPAMIGYSFGIEHALFGLVLGLWPLLQPGLFGTAPSWRTRMV